MGPPLETKDLNSNCVCIRWNLKKIKSAKNSIYTCILKFEGTFADILSSETYADLFVSA